MAHEMANAGYRITPKIQIYVKRDRGLKRHNITLTYPDQAIEQGGSARIWRQSYG